MSSNSFGVMWDRGVVSNSMAPDIIWKRIRKLNIPPGNVPEGHPVGSLRFQPGVRLAEMILVFWPFPFQSIKNVSPKTRGFDGVILVPMSEISLGL